MRRRRRLGYAAAVAVLVLAGFGSFRLYEALQPTPDVVTTAENLPGNSTAGSASGETELLTEQVGGTSVLVLRGSLLLTENV